MRVTSGGRRNGTQSFVGQIDIPAAHLLPRPACLVDDLEAGTRTRHHVQRARRVVVGEDVGCCTVGYRTFSTGIPVDRS